MNRFLTAFAGVVCLLVAVATTSAAGNWSGTDAVVEGVRTIQNPATPVEPPARVEMKELWRIGGDTDNEDEFFGVISKILADGDGNVYLLDSQLHEIKIFSPDGEFVRTIGAEGEGPGEFQFATDMFFTPTGNVGVMQAFPPKIVQLSKTGEPAGLYEIAETPDPGFRFLLNARTAGDYLVIAAGASNPGEGTFTQSRYLAATTSEKEIVRYYSEDRELNIANMVIDESKWDTFDRRWDLGPDRRVYAVLEQGAYRIHVWKEDGSVDRVIEREYEPLVRTDDERDRMLEIYKSFSRQWGGGNAKFEINDTHRGIEQFYIRDDNSLWVLTSHGSRQNPEGTIGTYDVFDPEGRFIKQVTLTGEGDPTEDFAFFVGNRVYIVRGFLNAAMASLGGGDGDDSDEEPEPVAVICYMLDDDVVAMK